MGDNSAMQPSQGFLKGPLALQQRVLPNYRVDFFDTLAAACPAGLYIFAGQPRRQEAIEPAEGLAVARWTRVQNIHLFGGRFYLCWQKNLLGWLMMVDPAALIVEANPRCLSTPLGVTWMHMRQRPVIGWGLGTAHTRRGLFNPRRGFLHQFDALITYSQRGAEEYRAAGFPPDLVFVAPNAVTHHPDQLPPTRPAAFSGQPVILFVGRLQVRKRIDNLLHACAALPAASQPRLLIVGDGPARDDFEALARQVYPSTEFFGALYGAELAALFGRADLFVLPGSGGLAVQQALSYALPVVVAEADGTQQDLVRPENGWQVPANDISALAQALQTALADPLRLRQMGAASYRIVSEEINIENMVSVFLKVLAVVTH